MNRVLTQVAIIVAQCVIGWIGLAADLGSAKPSYASMKNLDAEKRFVERIWDGKGIVIVGRLSVPNDLHIASRTPIQKDGSYCTALYPGRRLVFYAHGCNPLEITKYSEIAPNVYDAGPLTFCKATGKDVRELRGKVVAQNSAGKSVPVTCALQIRNEEYLWQDHGYQGGARLNVTVASQDVSQGQTLAFSGLSRIPYDLVVRASGFIGTRLPIARDGEGVIDVGTVTLAPAKTLRITYKVRVRKNGGEWTGDDSIKTAVISCDGASAFRFTNQRDGLGNTLELRMTPTPLSVAASFFFYKPDSFYQLGRVPPTEIPKWNDVDISAHTGSPNVQIQDGNLYFFTVDDINSTDIQVLFHVAEE